MVTKVLGTIDTQQNEWKVAVVDGVLNGRHNDELKTILRLQQKTHSD